MSANVSQVEVWQALWSAWAAAEAWNRRCLCGLGLGLRDYAVLHSLYRDGPAPVNEIGRRVHLTSGSSSIAIARMEKRGWIARARHPRDRRISLVELSSRGRRLIEQVSAAHATQVAQVVVRLNAAERRQVVALLDRISGRARDLLKAGQRRAVMTVRPRPPA